MQTGQDNRLALIALLLTLGLFIALGILAHSVWVPVCSFAGVVLLSRAGYVGVQGNRAVYIALTLAGLALVGIAAFGSHFAGRWLWTLIGLLLFFNLATIGGALKRANARGAGNLAMLLGLTCAVLGILGPWFLHGASPEAPSMMAGLSSPSFDLVRGFGAMKALLSIRSLWGMLYAVVLCFLGALLRKKAWDYLIALAAIVLAVGIAGSIDARVTPAVLHFFSSNPVVLMKDLVVSVGGKLGSPGRGPLLGGLLLPVILIPAIIETLRAARAYRELHAVKRMLGATLGGLYLRRAGGPSTFMLLATVITRAAPVGLAIALWIALRQLSGAGQVLPFQQIPDIALPHWRPIWQFAYIGIGVVIGFLNLGFLIMRRNRGLLGPMNAHPFLVLIAPILLSLVAPAGVMLFIGPMCWTWQMITLVALVHMAPPRRPEVEDRVPPPAREEPARVHVSAPYLPDMSEIEAEPAPPVESETLLSSHSAPIVDLLAMEPGSFVGIDSSGGLFRARGGKTEEIARLDTVDPLGLSALPDGRVAVVDRGGRIMIVDVGASPVAIDEIRASGEILACAFNGFGTIMAHTPGGGRILLTLLSSRKEQTLIDGLGTIAALAYSADNTKLAVGTREGDIHLIDMASRRKAATLTSTMPPPLGVLSVAEGPDKRWVTAHENHFVARWSVENRVECSQKMKDEIRRFTLDRETGKIAFATPGGRIHVVSPDLRITFLAPDTDQVGITKLLLVDSGAVVVSAAADGTIHRVGV